MLDVRITTSSVIPKGQGRNGALCWTCTHGIRADEPHRVYLFHFPALGVFKVGITHNRHDQRIVDHQVAGGVLVDSAVVRDRRTALDVETQILALYRPYQVSGVGPTEFPQGGWTETWSADNAPPLDLGAICATATNLQESVSI